MSAPHARASGAGRAAEAPEGAVVDRASGLGSHLGALGGLLSALRRSCGAKIWVALVFLVLGTLSEGASILRLNSRKRAASSRAFPRGAAAATSGPSR